MPQQAIATLQGLLSPHVSPGKGRLETLSLIVAGMVRARTATDLLAPNVPKRKAHGHYAKSWFRVGFDRIRQLLRTNPPEAVKPWQRIAPKKPKPPRVVSCEP